MAPEVTRCSACRRSTASNRGGSTTDRERPRCVERSAHGSSSTSTSAAVPPRPETWPGVGVPSVAAGGGSGGGCAAAGSGEPGQVSGCQPDQGVSEHPPRPLEHRHVVLDDEHQAAGRLGRLGAGVGVLDGHALLGRYAECRGCRQVGLGVRLAPLDLLAGDHHRERLGRQVGQDRRHEPLVGHRDQAAAHAGFARPTRAARPRRAARAPPARPLRPRRRAAPPRSPRV